VDTFFRIPRREIRPRFPYRTNVLWAVAEVVAPNGDPGCFTREKRFDLFLQMGK
jgi:hypothetical protein